ncbi:MAG: heat-inducible transcriptional repressor HrcA [Bryobacteraceae bacterium]|nr:heat-inducible transcriptional repressor HrcA [Bryobacteraceae bacterium]MDW8380109.1 heat-inducible transcriptional repressor HrcA [Bryobacterales bacterium]
MRSGGNLKKSSLPPRSAEILHSIVSAYIESGEPVASRTVSRRTRTRLSPASIRNIMADLSEEGYLSQPHTSAGRIPTAKAFQDYVQTLQIARYPSLEASRLREEIEHTDGVEARVEKSSHLLTKYSKNMGIAAAIPTENQVLHQVELMPLADRRVLMIVVTRDRIVRDKVVTLDQDIPRDELISIRNYINENFSGWSFSAIQRELRVRLEEERAVYDRILRRLISLLERGLLDIGLAPTLHTEGASNLVGLDLHLTREKMRELFRALEEKKRILELLDRFLQPSGEVGVQVGLEEVHPNMSELALIGFTVELPTGLSAKVAVLGPMRMNYERVMSAVYHVGQALRMSATEPSR